MTNIHGICFCFLFVFSHTIHSVLSSVYTSKTQFNPLKHVKLDGGRQVTGGGLAAVVRRTRRDAGEGSPAGGGPPRAGDEEKLSVHYSNLPDSSHNEAIVHWSGKNSKVMFVLTREHYSNGSIPDSALWRSDDYGSVFEKKMGFPNGTVLRYYYSCPNNKNKLLFSDVKNKMIFVTTDEGKTITPQSKVNFSPDRLVFHPKREDSVLAYSYKDRSLYSSSDLGKTWDRVAEYVNSRFYWAIEGVDQNDTVIHIEKQDPTTGHYQYVTCDIPYCRDVTFDSDIGYIDMDSLVVQNQYIFIQKSTQFSTTLLVSYKRKPFRPAFFPLNVHPQDFSIVNTDEEQVFIAADHKETTVNLYLSDTTGHFYIKSLHNVVALRKMSGGFDADLYEVRGVMGTYIANQYTDKNPKTLITFDQGREWRQITAPTTDVNNKPTNCHLPGCGLHIHLGFSQAVYHIPYILSEDNAPGIIFAQGHVGSDLAKGTTAKSTLFMSRDGGLTWKALFDGEFNYNILDQGGAMVIVPDNAQKKTKEIYYSCTEGATWQKYEFHKSLIQVDGVLNEPGITTLIVSIYGHIDKHTGWAITKVDFSSILSQQCRDDDYEMWAHTDTVKGSNLCLLGKRLHYRRRKQMVECRNGADHEKNVNVTRCICTKEDYECDYGYVADTDGNCKAETSWFNPKLPVGECPEDTYYPKSKGYRLIAADDCIKNSKKDEDYEPVRTKCPKMPPEGVHISMPSLLAVTTGKMIIFHLTQEKGSKKHTSYTWSSGDRTKPNVTFTGFEHAKLWNTTYMHRGNYMVSITASNTLGTARHSLLVRVEDPLLNLMIDLPHGAKVNHDVNFQVTTVMQNLSDPDAGHVHFQWTFGDETKQDHALLTYDTAAFHKYITAGNYSVSVEAFNSVGSIVKKIIVPVYGTLTTVQLTFNRETDELNERTEAWRKDFAGHIKESMMDLLYVSHTRLEVVVLPGFPTRADVSILPTRQSMSTDPTIDQLVQILMANVHGLVINKAEAEDTGDQASVIAATILKDKTSVDSHTNYIAVFLCVPILLIAIFVSALIVLYYKRKFSGVRHYSILHSHSTDDVVDSLLESEDDDDPPLDPDPDFTQRRRDSGDADLFGTQSTLVMMTGTNSDNNSNTAEC